MKRKINVGIFTHDFFPIFGGQGRHIHELYKQNRKYKSVNMYVFSPNKNQLEGHVQLFPETKNSKLKNLEFSFKLHTQIDKLIDKYNLDIVHIHGGPGGLFLLKKLRVPVIYTCHHTYWQQYKYIKEQYWKFPFFLLERWSYRNVVRIISVSLDTKRILLDKYGVKEDKLVFIPNGISTNSSAYSENKSFSQSKELLFVGRLDVRKGIDFLIETMLDINKMDPAIRLNIIGKGGMEYKLKNYVQQNNLNVVFHGNLSDGELNKLYKKVAIQVVPSVFEGFGIAVLEGMARRIPIIGTRVDGIKGIIEDGYNGMLVEYGNKRDLFMKIFKLLNNKEKRSKLVNNSLQELPKYTWSQIFFRHMQIYQEVANVAY